MTVGLAKRITVCLEYFQLNFLVVSVQGLTNRVIASLRFVAFVCSQITFIDIFTCPLFWICLIARWTSNRLALLVEPIRAFTGKRAFRIGAYLIIGTVMTSFGTFIDINAGNEKKSRKF